jgi:hypothetical protein
VCTARFQSKLDAVPGARWRVRLVKGGGRPAHVRVELRVWPPR